MKNEKIHRQVEIIKYLSIEDRTNTEILNWLKIKNHRYSTSTLSNDIRELKESGFMIDDSIKGKYSLIKSEYDEFQSHFIKFQSMAIAYGNSMKFSKQDMQCILFEPNALEFNLDIFEPVYKAIRERKKIKFTYESWQYKTKKDYELSPFVLKEYQNRWYVIGETKNGFRSFSLERISNFEITKTKIATSVSKTEQVIEKLENVVGVSFNEEKIKPEFITLKIDNTQKKYIETTPIFKNQEIIEEHKNYFILQMFVANTIELRQKILKYGHRIEVLKPEKLRNQIASEVSKLYRKYK